jgi:Mn-dependent DtxR family transcriptional regulator
MKKLRELTLIDVDADGNISLTPEGEKTAAAVYERHSVLYDWLRQIGVSPSVAAADACRIEHVLTQETFEAIKTQLK